MTYKQKLISKISELSEKQIEKFYFVFQILKREFIKKENSENRNLQDDFRSISVWESDDFDEIDKGLLQC